MQNKARSIKHRLPSRAVAERYDVCDRTIKRWEDTGILPRPILINGRKYWDETELEEAERAGMGRQTTKPRTAITEHDAT